MAATHPDMDLFDDVCKHVAEGNSVKPYLASRGVHHATFYDWLNHAPNKDELQRRYQAAKDEGEEKIAHGTRAIARGGEGSTGDVQRDKMIVENDWKFLAKMNVKRWGDRVQQDVTVSTHDDFLLSLVKGADK